MQIPVPYRRRGEGENMIPLINIVFLLLIFFMLAGAISQTDLFDVTPPQSSSGTPADVSQLIVLVSAEGRIALDGSEVEDDELVGRAADLLRADPDLQVHLRADGEASALYIVSVMDRLRKAGAERLSLLTIEDR